MQDMTDTPPEIAEMVRARLMTLSGAERFRMGAQMFDAARRMVLASLPADLSDDERKRRLFQRLYGISFPACPGNRPSSSANPLPSKACTS
jgi:hypothetical protein